MTTGRTVQALNTLKNLLHQRLAESEWLSKEVGDARVRLLGDKCAPASVLPPYRMCRHFEYVTPPLGFNTTTVDAKPGIEKGCR